MIVVCGSGSVSTNNVSVIDQLITQVFVTFGLRSTYVSILNIKKNAFLRKNYNKNDTVALSFRVISI